jgi:hypothetical protein
MSVWDEVDKLKLAHEAEKKHLLGKVREFFEAEARITVNAYGTFKLAWRKDNQTHELTGQTLAVVLDKLRALAPKKPLELRGGVTNA